MQQKADVTLTAAQLAHRIADIILDKKGLDLVVLAIGETSDIADYMIIASGTNRRQVQAMAESISKDLKQLGRKLLGLSGTQNGWWILMDTGEVLVHLMQEDARRYYDLEALWADARVVRRGVDAA